MKAGLLGAFLLAAAAARGAAFDPANEPVRWIGQTWQIADKPAQRARFERYLAASPEEIAALEVYDSLLDRIPKMLAAENIGAETLDGAFAMLPRASAFAADDGLADALAARILAAWQAQRQAARMEAAEASLDKYRQELAGAPDPPPPGAVPRERQIAAVDALLLASRDTAEIAPADARGDFQTFVAELFLRRRFRHVAIATAFYRNIFDDADQRLRLPSEGRELFGRLSDIPPTMGAMDTLARAAARRAEAAVSGVGPLAAQGKLHAASNRLAEAFAFAEHTPPVARFPSADRQRLLAFARADHRLHDAMDAKDYGNAARFAEEARGASPDFDPRPIVQAAQAAKDKSNARLERARAAAASGDSATLAGEVRAAAEMWPSNPGLTEFSGEKFGADTVRQRALEELDRLIEQNDRAEIFRQRAKFMDAASSDPARRAKLEELIGGVEGVQDSLRRARALQQQGDSAAAWESLQQAARQFPGDADIAQMSNTLAKGGAAAFVRALEQGAQWEAKGDHKRALQCYRDLQRQYPQSRLAKEKARAAAARVPPDSPLDEP